VGVSLKVTHLTATTYAQQLAADERQRLELCGMQDEPELDSEDAEDAERHYDFVICGRSDRPWRTRPTGGTPGPTLLP
jgi:hypothetical protein